MGLLQRQVDEIEALLAMFPEEGAVALDAAEQQAFQAARQVVLGELQLDSVEGLGGLGGTVRCARRAAQRGQPARPARPGQHWPAWPARPRAAARRSLRLAPAGYRACW